MASATWIYLYDNFFHNITYKPCKQKIQIGISLKKSVFANNFTNIHD